MEKIWLKEYTEGVPAEIDLSKYSSIPDIMEKAFAKFGTLPAFHQMGKSITYNELSVMSKKFGSYLQNELKLQPGDRVALMMPNILQYPIALFGILAAGMVAVNVNPLYTARELEHQLKDSGAKAIVIFANSASVLQKIVDKTDLKQVIVTSIGDMLGFPKAFIVNTVIKYVKKMVPDWSLPGSVSFKEALSRGDERTFRPAAVKLSDIAFLQYTGGTTGVSKGAILVHENIVANVLQAGAWIGNYIEEGKEIMITPLPLYHIFSLTANCLIFSSIGALNVLITNPRDIPNFVKELKKWKFTSMTGVNTLFNALINNEDFKNLDFSHLKVALGGGMAVQEPVARKWKEITGTTLVEAYGLTETSPAACMNPMTIPDYTGFIGLPIPSTEVSIRDDNAVEVPQGQVGEICIKGPQVMKGYWQRPEETAKVMTADGFFKTGDMGFMTEKGYVKLVDRKKDMILVSGFNVYPNEIEEVMVGHPKVLEAAAIGVADAKSGEAVKLFVVKKDQSLTEEELRAYCKENFTGYKIPKYFEFRTELPKSNVGKILRKDLRQPSA
ncbi:MAG: long-chain-fatty-acid--CoA ligase [Deltaproteobacteria bacterium]|nr:long-chain-fatty-acid--CoA ligase [Deltaproteobacteria bacterium]